MRMVLQPRQSDALVDGQPSAGVLTWVAEQAEATWEQAGTVWVDGGWAMYPLAVIALLMFGFGFHVLLNLREKQFQSVPEHTWRRWIDHPRERRGPIGRMLDFVTGGASIHDTASFFKQLRATESGPFDRDLKVMRICIAAAPLMGLLGTVTGMLNTFTALATGGGGDKTMTMVARGISEALVTTMTGLVIALPGVFFQYVLMRRYEMYSAFLAHLETVCVQTLHRRRLQTEQEQAEAAARRQIAERLRGALAASGAATAAPPVAGPARRTQGFLTDEDFAIEL